MRACSWRGGELVRSLARGGNGIESRERDEDPEARVAGRGSPGIPAARAHSCRLTQFPPALLPRAATTTHVIGPQPDPAFLTN
jgi:hypothetical protein